MTEPIKAIDRDTIECGEFALSKVAGDWNFIEFEGENITWTNEQCDQLYELLKYRQELLDKGEMK